MASGRLPTRSAAAVPPLVSVLCWPRGTGSHAVLRTQREQHSRWKPWNSPHKTHLPRNSPIKASLPQEPPEGMHQGLKFWVVARRHVTVILAWYWRGPAVAPAPLAAPAERPLGGSVCLSPAAPAHSQPCTRRLQWITRPL